MKKPISYFLLLTFSIFTLISCSLNKKDLLTGIYLKSTDEVSLIISESGEPIVMVNNTGKDDIFDNLKSGDKIEVTFDSLLESYPARTQIYSFKLIEEGNSDNIPKDTLKTLEEMGWNFELSN